MMEGILAPRERAALERAIAEEQANRRHLVIALSGAHAYGFPSPDSDLDLKAVHVDPTATVLGLVAAPPHADRLEVLDGVEIDYTSNELKPVLLGVLHGNGNYLERLLGRLLPFAAPELDELRPLVRAALSRRLQRHYLGFASSQLRAFASETTAKKLLYVLRTALTGAHALATGEIVTDLRDLADEHGFGDARELIAAKRAGERVLLAEATAERWVRDAERAIARLADAQERSILPEEPPPSARAALEAWLVEERRKRF